MRGGLSSLPRGREGRETLHDGIRFLNSRSITLFTSQVLFRDHRGWVAYPLQVRGVCILRSYIAGIADTTPFWMKLSQASRERGRTLVAHDFPVPEPDDAVEILFMPVLVRDHHNGLVHLLVDLPEQFQYYFRIF